MSPSCLDLTPNGNVGDGKSRLVINVSILASSEVIPTVMFQGSAESSFNWLKRWASFTRRLFHSLMVGHGYFSVRAPEAELPNWQKPNRQTKIPRRRKEGLKTWEGKRANNLHHVKGILFKSNIFRNPIPGALCPKWLNTLQGDYLKHLWFEKNTSVSQPHPSVVRDSETSPKNATSKSKPVSARSQLASNWLATSPSAWICQTPGINTGWGRSRGESNVKPAKYARSTESAAGTTGSKPTQGTQEVSNCGIKLAAFRAALPPTPSYGSAEGSRAPVRRGPGPGQLPLPRVATATQRQEWEVARGLRGQRRSLRRQTRHAAPARALGPVSPSPSPRKPGGCGDRGVGVPPDPWWLQKTPLQSWPSSQHQTKSSGRGKGRTGGWGEEPTCRWGSCGPPSRGWGAVPAPGPRPARRLGTACRHSRRPAAPLGSPHRRHRPARPPPSRRFSSRFWRGLRSRRTWQRPRRPGWFSSAPRRCPRCLRLAYPLSQTRRIPAPTSTPPP